jgi:hypothetical protein
MFSRAAICACILFAVALPVLAAPAAASDVRATTDAELASALALAQPGDSIALAAGSYAPIAITGRGGPDADITLRGEPGATIAGMAILASTRIVVRDLTVAPASATAYVTVTSSSSVAFGGLRVDGGDAGLGATIWIDADAAGVSVRDSTFRRCASPMCIRASGPDVLIEHNVFDELYDSDAVHGFGSGMIRGNHMDHALPHGDGNHNDFIQIGEGGPWTIEGNWFGERTGGAASIWVDSIRGGVIHDVLVQNNVLTGHYAGQDVGIFIAGDDRSVALLPTNVRVISNTVTSGLLNSLRFGAAYSTIPGEQRPLVANNVGDRLAGMCDRIRSVDNVFAVGEACAESDVIGDAALDSTGAPTAASTLLLGRADPSLATPVDFFGCARAAPPDIGAIEFAACPAAPAIVAARPAAAATTLSAQPQAKAQANVRAKLRAKLRARISSVRARRVARHVVLVVRSGNALRVRVTVVAGGRIVSRASRAGTASGRVRFVLHAPRGGRIVVRVRATGAGGGAARSIALA